MTKEFIPADFEPPVEARIGRYVLRPLTEDYADADLAAVNSSVELIRETRGGTWPQTRITLEDDHADLIEHRQEFERRSSFAYAILSEDQSSCVGSVYVYPPNHPFDDSDKSLIPEDADAVVSFWASQAAYDDGFYPVLNAFVAKWLHNEWPFKAPYISNKLIPAESE